MQTLTLPDGTEHNILEDADIGEIPEMTLVELQCAYMGMLTVLVSAFGEKFAVEAQNFATQYLDALAEQTEVETG